MSSIPERASDKPETPESILGSQIDLSDEHPSNAQFPINERRDPDSNANVERRQQSVKQDFGIRSIDAGTKIDRSVPHPRNASSRSDESLEPGWKAKCQR
jgi:hypothetical protein